ncbi:hypothetical protein H6P81_020166 [Aristolochia fimbriata]|uniref:50S ribosomal protein 6, chloroplastic n=1 Tax=Aristolochia fimbriata TaxID=158543 RepID=A0AAV7DUV6_ARIFI|nr:hypothetical protein H6P81_020166 [Aristolochia fimbriata]
MSISSLTISRAVVPSRAPHFETSRFCPPSGKPQGLVVECSSRPQKKGTKHHMKTRPKKTQPWDIRRKPAVYAPLPPLPPDWTVLESSQEVKDGFVAAPAVAVQED